MLQRLVLLGILIFSASVLASNGRTTYQAKIIKPDGYPLQAASVNFRFTVLDTVGSCILYVEDYAAVNMQDTGGLISFALGNGARSFPTSGTSQTFQNIFDNSVASMPCQNAGIYNPTIDDTRRIVMQFNDGAGWQTLPAMTINAVPYAMYADKANVATTLNNKADTAFVEYATLASLNCNAATHAITFNGVSFSCIAVGSGSGSGITSVTTSGSVLTMTGTASAPIIGIQAVSVSQDGYLTALDYSEFKSKLAASSTQIINTLGYEPANSVSLTSLTNSVAVSFAGITSSQWVTSGTDISYINGQVGIGTSDAESTLQVNGNLILKSNQAVSFVTVVGSFDSSATTLTVNNAQGFPESGVLILRGSGNQIEAIRYSLKTSTTFENLERGLFGRQVRNFLNGDTVNLASVIINNSNNNPQLLTLGSGEVFIGNGLPIRDNTLNQAEPAVAEIHNDADSFLRISSNNNFKTGLTFRGAGDRGSIYVSSYNYFIEPNALYGTGHIILNAKNGASNVGLGIVNPTAKLQIASGTSAVAPLKFTSGTLLGVAQAGAVEYDGNQLYFTDASSTRRAIATNSAAGSFDNTNLIQNTSGSITLAPNSTTGAVIVSATTASLNSSTGALIVAGGLGVAGNINTAANLNVAGEISANILKGNTNLLLNPDGGNVGIGVSSPTQALTVSGTLMLTSPQVGGANIIIASEDYGQTSFNQNNNIVIGGFNANPNLSAPGSGGYNVIIGRAAQTSGGGNDYFNTVIGYDAKSLSVSPKNVVVGSKAEAFTTDAVAVGFEAKVHGLRSVAFGSSSSASGTNTGAIGYNNKVVQDETYAYGKEPQAENSANNSTLHGFGTALPDARLSVKGLGITSATNALTVKNKAGNLSMLVRDDGYVGIGVSSPTSMLEVKDLTGNSDYEPVIKVVADRSNSERAVIETYTENSTGADNFIFMTSKVVSSVVTSISSPPSVLMQTFRSTPMVAGDYFGAYLARATDTTGSHFRDAAGLRFMTPDGATTEFRIGLNSLAGSAGGGIGRSVLTGTSNGQIGVDMINPTAKLNIAAGTNSVAPIKLTSGTLLTSPQSGTIEYDGFNFYVTDSANTRRSIATVQNQGSFDNTNSIANASGNIVLSPNSTTGSVVVSATTPSISSDTGALVVKGGVGVQGNINASGSILTSANIQGASITATSGIITPAIYGTSNLGLNPSGGNVGIGTNNPTRKLHIHESSGGPSYLQITASSTGVGGMDGFQLAIDGSTSEAGIIQRENSLLYFSTNNIPRLNITGNGNVGIGTTNPTAKLVIDAGSVNDFAIRDNSIENHKYDNDNAEVAVNYVGYQAGLSRFRTLTVYNGKQSALATFQGSSGNVGIGTTSPGYKLQVSGTASVNDKLWASYGNQVMNGYSWVDAAFTTNSIEIVNNNGTDPTKAATLAFHTHGSGGPQFRLDSNGSKVLYLESANVNSARVASAYGGGGNSYFSRLHIDGELSTLGRIGIGITNPSTHLDIAGQVQISGVNQASPPAGLAYGLWAQNNRGLGLYSAATGANQGLGIWTNKNGSTPTESLTILRDGNVGIGTTTPIAHLDVNGSLATRGAMYRSSIGNTGVTGQWVKLGKWTADQQGRNLLIRIEAGSGYNATTSQMGSAEIRIRTSNGSSVNANGFCAASTYKLQGAASFITSVKVVSNLSGCSASDYDVFAFMQPFTGVGSFFTVETDLDSSWQNDVVIGSADPGVASALVDVASILGNTTSGDAFFLNGSVGIGTLSPIAPLEVKGGPVMGGGWSRTLRLEAPHPAIQLKGTSQENKSAWIEYDDATSTNSISFRIGGTNDDVTTAIRAMSIISSGNVGIGTVVPSQKLHVVGDARIQGTVTDCYIGNGSGGTSCSSDERLKENIKPIPYALEKINSLRGVEFEWNQKSQSFGRHDIGVIAQDVEKVFPTAVIAGDDGYKKVDYAVLVAPLIQAVKELYNLVLSEKVNNVKQDRQIASLAESKADKAEIEFLKAENIELKKKAVEFDALKAYLCSKDPEASICK